MATTPLHLSMPWADWLRKAGLGLVICGPWSFVALALIDKGALGQEAVAQLIAWGPAALILVALWVLVERWVPRAVAAQTESALAQQKLASSVQQLVDRGDRDSRETINLMRYVQDEQRRMHAATTQLLEDLRGEMRAARAEGGDGHGD